jgi:hypothetical protein
MMGIVKRGRCLRHVLVLRSVFLNDEMVEIEDFFDFLFLRFVRRFVLSFDLRYN